MPGVRKCFDVPWSVVSQLLNAFWPLRETVQLVAVRFTSLMITSAAPDALAQVKRGLKGLFGRKKKAPAQTQSDASSSQQTPSQTTPEVQNPTITTTAPSPSPGQPAEQKTRIGMFGIRTFTPASWMPNGLLGTKLADTNLRADDGFPPPPPGPPPSNAGGAPTPLPSQAQQISEPAGVGEAKNIDLDPSSTTAPAATSSAPADTSATTTTEPAASSTTASQSATGASPQPTVDRNGMSATSGPLDDSIGMGEYEPGKASVDDADGSKFLEKERDLENDMPSEGDGAIAQGSASVEGGKIEQTTASKA